MHSCGKLDPYAAEELGACCEVVWWGGKGAVKQVSVTCSKGICAAQHSLHLLMLSVLWINHSSMYRGLQVRITTLVQVSR